MSERRGVPAAEKYAELLANGQERPRCACHQESMFWHKDKRKYLGGYWKCIIEMREDSRRQYRANPEKDKKRARLYRESNPVRTREMSRRYWEAHPEKRAAGNAARIMVGSQYLGICKFNQTEVEAMLSGTSD